MPTKTNGPLMEDYKRALKAAKWAGAKGVVVHIAGTPVVIPLDNTYLDKLALGQLPAPDPEEAKREPHNWKDW